jgi:hypothetical protein
MSEFLYVSIVYSFASVLLLAFLLNNIFCLSKQTKILKANEAKI